ncbi:MAG: ArsC/Spx/MgsR family protein [Pseudomonadota bacterium]
MMSVIRFYEKPGCINNTKQKAFLTQAGYRVEARNLLAEPWTRERLEAFFGDMSVAERFNRSAPQITSGQVDPDNLDEDSAYRMMLDDPLLIRRPLMAIGAQRLVGFELQTISRALALEWSHSDAASLETCPRAGTGPCGHP